MLLQPPIADPHLIGILREPFTGALHVTELEIPYSSFTRKWNPVVHVVLSL